MTEPYRAHQYSGRENGLMVITSPDRLRELGTQLANFDETKLLHHPDWPSEVASLNLGTMERPFTLSFHVERAPGRPAGNVPAQSKSPWVLGVGALLAVVGLGTVAKWVIGAF